ncbi:unnamed protein product, partial [Penicillium nalgiovense]
RKTLTREARQNLENRLYRWTRDLSPSLRLFCSRSTCTSEDATSPKRTLARYNFESRQLHIPYFICLAIMLRPNPGESASLGVLLASSFIAGIFEDFLARDEIQFLSPVFTFHLLAAGIGLLSCNNVPSQREKAAGSLESIYLALEELSKRWSSAKGSLSALKSIAEKQRSTSTIDEMPSMTLSREHQPFFEGFGPELSWAWSYFMDLGQAAGNGGNTNRSMVAGIPEVLGNWTESRAPDAISSDEYRPLTTILDRNEGLTMGDMSQDISGDFFNQYQGMGDWLFKDLEWNAFHNLSLERHENVFVLTMQKPPENRLNSSYCQEMIRAYRTVEKILGSDSEGAVITRGNDAKFWCTLIHTILDFPFPTIALLTGHTFGGACPLALAHDYRVMNSRRGFISMPPVNLGLHFDGIGSLPRLKLRPQVARKMLLEAHRWTGPEALEDGIVDVVAEPEDMLNLALELGAKWAPKAKMGVYALLRQELWGDAIKKFQRISYVHSRVTSAPAKVKI